MLEYPKTYGPFKRDENKKLLINEPSFEEFVWLSEAPWSATEKLHGMPARMHMGETEFQLYGRTSKTQLTSKQYEALEAWNANHAAVLSHFKVGTTFYGELIGPGIQGNPYQLSSYQFRAFAATNADDVWLDTDYVQRVFYNDSSLSNLFVPIIGYPGFVGSMPNWVQAVANKTITSALHPDGWIEGVVLNLAGGLRFKDRPVVVKIRESDVEEMKRQSSKEPQ